MDREPLSAKRIADRCPGQQGAQPLLSTNQSSTVAILVVIDATGGFDGVPHLPTRPSGRGPDRRHTARIVPHPCTRGRTETFGRARTTVRHGRGAMQRERNDSSHDSSARRRNPPRRGHLQSSSSRARRAGEAREADSVEHLSAMDMSEMLREVEEESGGWLGTGRTLLMRTAITDRGLGNHAVITITIAPAVHWSRPHY